MPDENGAPELYRKYRPKSLKGIIGQPDAVKTLQSFVESGKIPHAILFTGPSGNGKTTMTYILKNKLECSDHDFKEINAAQARGIDTIRDIEQHKNFGGLGGKNRIWYLDECHKLTNEAQNALLKLLESPPSRVYILMATTDPQKLIPTIITRSTEIKVRSMRNTDMEILLNKIAGKEGVTLSEAVRDRIIEFSDGSARKALVLLGQVIGMADEDDQLNAIVSTQAKATAIEICRALMNPKPKWNEIAKVLKECDEEPETIRHIILGYFNKVLLGGGPKAARACQLIEIFQYNTFDSRMPGLAAMCFHAIGN